MKALTYIGVTLGCIFLCAQLQEAGVPVWALIVGCLVIGIVAHGISEACKDSMERDERMEALEMRLKYEHPQAALASAENPSPVTLNGKDGAS